MSELLRAVADTLKTLPYKTWDFGDSVAFEGLFASSSALDDPQYLEFAHGWFRAWATRSQPFKRLDCTAPGAAMVRVALVTEDARILEAAARLAEYLLDRPRLESGLYATWEHSPLLHPYGPGTLDPRGAKLISNPPAGAFIDCLHFDPPFFTSLGMATATDEYVRSGVEQALAYVTRLQQADGLFNHFELEGEPGTFGRGWGRGQGWALLGLLDVVEELHGGTAFASERARLEVAALDLIRCMTDLQLDSGHWATNVRDASTGIENSTAAFMAVGFRRALRLGLVGPVDVESVGAAADRAHAAVLGALDVQATLDVSAAVMACTTDSHYEHVPAGFVVPWGQGPLALMLAEDGSHG